MEITTENISEQNVLVKFHFATEDYMPRVESSLKNYSKKIQLKGFRQGKVPAGVVKKMYGNEIMVEELNKMLNEKLGDYLKENNIQILGDPLPKRDENEMTIDINQPADQVFTYELGIQPEFEIPALQEKAEIVKYDIEVDDELVNEEIDNMRNRYGKMINPDEAQDGDVLYVELKELNEDGSVKTGGVMNMPAFPTEMLKNGEIKEKIINLKKSESINVDILDTFNPDKEELAQRILNIKKEQLDEINSQFELTLKNINRREKAELNEDFFTKIYGEGNIADEEAFRNKVKEELKALLNINADRKLNNDIADKLIKETSIELPEDFLKRWLKETNEKEINDEEMEQEFPHFLSNLKWSLIVNKLLREAGINVEREDIENRTRELIKMEYGLSGEDEMMQNYLNQFTDQMMKNKEHVQKVFENVRDQKVFDYLKGQLTLKEQAISFKEFKDLK